MRTRTPAGRMLWTLALGMGAALGVAIATSHRIPSVANAQVRISPVDAWLSANPTVANVMIWEFPPPREVKPIPRRFIVWQGLGFPPDPTVLAPLTDVVPLELTPGRGIEPGLEATALEGGWTVPSEVVPGHLPDWLPGGVQKSEYGAEIRSWSKWPDWAKAELRARFADYHQWAQNACALYAGYAASEFTAKPAGFDEAFSSTFDIDPEPVIDPPVNLQPHDPLMQRVPWQMVHSGSAFALYVRLVAAQLAMELSGCLPWSLVDDTTPDLRPLFDGRLIFRYVQAGDSEWGEMTATGHIVTTTVTPAPPLKVLGFLAQNGLIGSNRTDTLVRFLEWERTHLRHVVGGTPAEPYASGVLYWGYNGRAPVSRMINGTHMAEPLFFPGGGSYYEPDALNWVGGCGGASGFNEQVLRLVNVAAHRTAYEHFQNRFALDNAVHVGIGHGDDPYSLVSTPEIPVSGLLIDELTFNAWFVDETDPVARLKNVGRRAADLNIQYLPLSLLKYHCWDLSGGNVDHATSFVYTQRFSSTYSVAELEAMGLWTNIEAKIASLGGCAGPW